MIFLLLFFFLCVQLISQGTWRATFQHVLVFTIYVPDALVLNHGQISWSQSPSSSVTKFIQNKIIVKNNINEKGPPQVVFIMVIQTIFQDIGQKPSIQWSYIIFIFLTPSGEPLCPTAANTFILRRPLSWKIEMFHQKITEGKALAPHRKKGETWQPIFSFQVLLMHVWLHPIA